VGGEYSQGATTRAFPPQKTWRPRPSSTLATRIRQLPIDRRCHGALRRDPWGDVQHAAKEDGARLAEIRRAGPSLVKTAPTGPLIPRIRGWAPSTKVGARLNEGGSILLFECRRTGANAISRGVLGRLRDQSTRLAEGVGELGQVFLSSVRRRRAGRLPQGLVPRSRRIPPPPGGARPRFTTCSTDERGQTSPRRCTIPHRSG